MKKENLERVEESAAPPKPRWISVEEKLPEPNQTVFGRRDDDRVRVLEFCYDGVGGGENAPPDAGDWWWCEPYGDGEIDEFAYDLDTGDGPPNITHWMPIPKPPAKVTPSYIKSAINELRKLAQPIHISTLLTLIRLQRGDKNITRASLETSLLRYINSKGDKSEIVKIRPGTYVAREGGR